MKVPVYMVYNTVNKGTNQGMGFMATEVTVIEVGRQTLMRDLV